ncbi:J domain-containing protein [Haloferula sp. BvORR071]|uniref:DnaJ C-terminal domain-containing protein n=1 Tax=Haloferula sp. BvORR071 TaxID=1396141 RepID=UPI00055078F1|nr:J domain-containing protein [Haloferula sp. BvORR071]
MAKVKFRDYYEVLGVKRDASQDEIRKAFRKLARTHHPDVAKDKATAEDKFKEINEAYEVLGDADKRKKYDQLGEHWKHADSFGGGAGGATFWPGAGDEDRGGDYHFEGTGFSDFFENFFGSRASRGGFAARGPGGAKSNAPRRGRDIESEILVTLDEVMNGSERSLTIQAQDRRGERKPVTIRIPKGITEGQLIRAAGLGEPGQGGGAPGDLFLKVRLERHPDFRAEEHDLYYDLRLAPWESVLGATVPVRTPHGEMKIKVPPGTESGTEFRLSGKGLPKGKSGSFGDLFAVAQVVTPTTATEEERRHWQALADSSKFNPR